jgi:hypothetical protein
MLCVGGAVSAQTKPATMPDAQVEASVLKGLAGAPDLANQQISTTTVYGVVTLSGSVPTEAQRTEAENIVARTAGVQKVIDELTLGTGAPAPVADATNPNLQSDGTIAPQQPGPAAPGPNSDNTAPANQVGGPSYPQQYPGQAATPPGYGQPYPQQRYPQPGYAPAPQVYGGQLEGQAVTVPSGALVRMRINQSLDSAHAKAGDTFNGIVINDVVAGGAVAIPRGASVDGKVVAATKAGALAGRGELQLQLTQVTMGGKTYPIVSDIWGHHGADKTTETVNRTAVGGVIGALIGAAAGGGKGAAIGAGAGGALGLGSSAASPDGQEYVPAEGLLTFHLTQDAPVTTVSQAEMDRLGQGVPGAAQAQRLQRRYPAPYYGPRYYPPYPYPY